MKILKNFNKTITLVLTLTYLTFAVLAIVFGFTRELFAGDDSTYKITSYALVVGKTPVYTLPGICAFADDMALAATKSSSVSLYFQLAKYTQAAGTLKVLAILIFAFEGLFVFLQLPSFRCVGNMVTSLGLVSLLIILKSKAIANFKDLSLITTSTKTYNMIMAFWIVVFCISSLLLALKIILYLDNKKNKENDG